MAVNFQWIDGEKIGLSSGAVNPRIAAWLPSTVYAVGALVQNGGFYYRCTVGGASAALSGTIQSSGPSRNTLVDNAATWALVGPASQVCQQDAAQAHELGLISLAKDATYGIGEFIYTKFTGAVVAGDVVKWDAANLTAVQSGAVNGAAVFNKYGIAMGDQANGTFGWIMIRGCHDQANGSGAAVVGTTPSGTATAGRYGVNAGVVNYVLDGMVSRHLGVAGTGFVELWWPSCSGR